MDRELKHQCFLFFFFFFFGFAERCDHEGAGCTESCAEVHWGVSARKSVSIYAASKASSPTREG
jgi:hypothetical protein